MDNDFEGWRSGKEIALTRINNALSKVDERPIDGSETLEELLNFGTEGRREPGYKEAANELRDVIRDVCRVYLTATSDQLVGIRGLLKRRLSILFHLREYQTKALEHIHSPDDLEWLLIGLAAVSIEDRAIDYRDTYPLLARLYIQAARSGINPDPYFAQVASISSQERNLFGGISVSEMITEFSDKESGLYKQLVEPYL